MTDNLFQAHQNGADASFLKNEAGELCINFSDALYVRAQAVFHDVETSGIHLVVDDRLCFIGTLEQDMAPQFKDGCEVILSANHYKGGAITLTAPLKHT